METDMSIKKRTKPRSRRVARKGLTIKSQIRAGGLPPFGNHNRSLSTER
jgi:hypothetical protein